MSHSLSDAIDEQLDTKNPEYFKRELKSIYHQIIPNSRGERALGRYSKCEQAFREKPSLTNSFVRLLLDAGLTREPKKVMQYFGKGNEDLHVKLPLSDKERKEYTDYINSATFGEMFFQRRYGIVPLKEKTK
jgi:hypothetical protein